jgi:ribosome maturation factor RimP
MHPTEVRRHIRQLLEPTIQRLGFDLVAVDWLTAGGAILRLYIDGPRGVGADECARVSREVDPVLDQDDFGSGRYRLEVSSPGIDRPIERLEDFRRFVDCQVRIRLVEGFDRRRYTGKLVGVDGEDLIVFVDAAEHRLPFAGLERANLVLTLDEYLALGRRSTSSTDSNDSTDDPGLAPGSAEEGSDAQ